MPYYYVSSDSEDSDAGVELYDRRIQKRREQKRATKQSKPKVYRSSKGRAIEKKSLPIPSDKKIELEREASEYFDIYERVSELDLDAVMDDVDFLTSYVDLIRELQDRLESLIARASGNANQRFRRRVAFYVAACQDRLNEIAELVELAIGDGIEVVNTDSESESDSDSDDSEIDSEIDSDDVIIEEVDSESDSDSDSESSSSDSELEVDVNDSELDSDIVDAVLANVDEDDSASELSDSESSDSESSDSDSDSDELVVCSGCSDCENDFDSDSSSDEEECAQCIAEAEADSDSDSVIEVGSDDEEDVIVVEPSSDEESGDEFY